MESVKKETINIKKPQCQILSAESALRMQKMFAFLKQIQQI